MVDHQIIVLTIEKILAFVFEYEMISILRARCQSHMNGYLPFSGLTPLRLPLAARSPHAAPHSYRFRFCIHISICAIKFTTNQLYFILIKSQLQQGNVQCSAFHKFTPNTSNDSKFQSVYSENC